MTYFRRLVSDFLPCRPKFKCTLVRVEFVVDGVTVGQVLIHVSSRRDVFQQILRSCSTHAVPSCNGVMTHNDLFVGITW